MNSPAKQPAQSPSALCKPAVQSLTNITLDSLEAPENGRHFRRVLGQLWQTDRMVVVTGAGISVSAGIPDFRSPGGLYDLNEKTANGVLLRGRDFFDVEFWRQPTTRPHFYRFISKLREQCVQAEPTETHRFLAGLLEQGKMLRWYTQNIDGLERRVGATSDWHQEASNERANRLTKGRLVAHAMPAVVLLHGTLENLVCTHCKFVCPLTESHAKALSNGEAPSCLKCQEITDKREAAGRRRLAVGNLRPDIILYHEPHPQGDRIAELITADVSHRPSLLIVMGTSLKVIGLKRLVRDLAKAVHLTREGMVVYINRQALSAVASKEWQGIFDVQLIGDCDDWVKKLNEGKTLVDNVDKSEKVVDSKTPQKVKQGASKKDSTDPTTTTATTINHFFKPKRSIAKSAELSKTKALSDSPSPPALLVQPKLAKKASHRSAAKPILL